MHWMESFGFGVSVGLKVWGLGIKRVRGADSAMGLGLPLASGSRVVTTSQFRLVRGFKFI